MTIRPETNVRLTDILGDKILDRLGNAGNELLVELLEKFHNALGSPFEVTPSEPGNMQLTIAGAIYTLPDQKRIAPMRNGQIPQINSTIIDFQFGTISGGSNISFTNPSVTANNYIKSLIQYNYDLNAFDVTFGSENLNLIDCSTPVVKMNFEPICLVEMYSNGGVGNFSPILKQNLIVIIDSMDFESEPDEEKISTISNENTFNLSIITIPKQRKRLMIFLNGVYQIMGTHYNITSDTQVVFTENIRGDAELLFRVV